MNPTFCHNMSGLDSDEWQNEGQHEYISINLFFNILSRAFVTICLEIADRKINEKIIHCEIRGFYRNTAKDSSLLKC